MTRFQRHIFVCENQRDPANPKGSCKQKGSAEILSTIKGMVHDLGLKGTMRCNGSGCLDACEHGPTVVIYPEAVWYRVPTVADAQEVVQEHLVHGRVVDRLVIHFPPKAALPGKAG